ncbi:MAG: lipid-A-disaccharide synthase [Nitrospinae bacterium]|nr:lipid-A-disaccharide synthase [Nitrospinota bacterium]
MLPDLDNLIRPSAGKPIARKIMLITGEESGDLYAGRLVSELIRRIPGLVVEGIGGPRFRAAGGTSFYDIKQMAAVGFGGPLAKLGFYLGALREVKARLATGQYDGVVLIDLPDFNLRVAKAADAAGTPVFYYVAPQFWAWRRYRIRTVQRFVDMMIVALPFEEEFYKGRGINARFFGHPLLDELPEGIDRESLRREFGAGPGELLVGLMPGSRESEVERHLPMMLEALRLIRKRTPVRGVIACAESIDATMVEGEAKRARIESRVVRGKSWEVMNACDFLIAKSGTTTLQAAIAGTPTMLVYKVDMISYLIARALVHVKYAGLPNLVADEEVMPELLQGEATAENIATVALSYLTDPRKRMAQKEKLAGIRAALGERGASARAAEAMVSFLARMSADRR